MEKITQVGDEFVKSLFPPKKSDSNKGSYGTLLIIGGSARYAGAPLLASLGAAALTTGCGIATLAVPDFLMPAMWQRITHCTLYPLKSNDGFILLDTSQINDACNKPTAVIFGMGIGFHSQIAQLEQYLIETLEKPLLIDADGLNCLAENVDMLKKRKAPTVLTPHIGEMARLLKTDTKTIKENKIQFAVNFAKEYGVTLLLKDNVSVITDGTRVAVNEAGTPAMAKGGSGDLLSGIIGGLLARKIDTFSAAAAGAYIAGKAAEKAVKDSNEYSLLPAETAAYVKDVVTEIIKG